MTRPNPRYRGVMPALPVPLKPDGSPNLSVFRRLVTDLVATPGVTGFLINGHAGENTILGLGHQRAVAEAAVETVAGRVPVVAGVNAPATDTAVDHAIALDAAGVDSLLIFPPDGWALGVSHETIVHHHAAIVEATRGDIVLFQGSVKAGALAFTQRTLDALVRLPRVCAVKEGSWEVATYEANRRLVRNVAPHVAVMGSGDEHLFTSAVVGSEGAMVSLAAVTPEPIVELLRAVDAGDLARAKAAHEGIYPIAKAVYGELPTGFATQRLKTCLVMLEAFESDRMVAPGQPTPSEEVPRLRAALRAAGALR